MKVSDVLNEASTMDYNFELIEEENIWYIYYYIRENCKPFLNEINNDLKKLPIRSFSNIGDRADGLFKGTTRKERKSLVMDIEEAFNHIDNSLRKNGHASRKYHSMSTSSLAKMTTFPVTRFDPRIIPIGEFRYSYIEGDFNDHGVFEDYNNVVSDFYKYLLNGPEYLEDVHTIEEFFELLKSLKYNEEIPFTIREEIDMIYLPAVESALERLQRVKSEDLSSAFKSEHEIWFNTQEFYILNHTQYEQILDKFN